MKHLMTWLDESLDEWFEEIAGKQQYDCGHSKERAEQIAAMEVSEMAKRRKAVDADKAVNK